MSEKDKTLDSCEYKNVLYDERSVSVSATSVSEDEVAKEESELTVYTKYRMNESRFRWFWRASYFIDQFGEIRGVERQRPDNRQPDNIWYYLKMTAVWSGSSLSLVTMTGFFLGATLFNLSFKAATSSSVFGIFVGSAAAAFGITMGSRSGLRGMMGVKFQFGWWFGRFIALLNCLTLIGWTMISGNFGGQLLSAMTNSRISVEIGILIIFLITLVLSVFGLKLMIRFDSVFVIPLLVAFILCYICTAETFDTRHVSKVSGEDLRIAWVSNFGSCIGITSTYLPVAADYHMNIPEKTNKWLLYLVGLFWIFVPSAFVGVLGCSIASVALYNPAKAELYQKLGGAGLLVEAMRKWHGGGIFLCVVMYISLITNASMALYSCGLSLQACCTPLAHTPRYILATVVCIIWYVLAAVGKNGWAQVVSNFMPMIGYWSMIYFTILAIETLWFRRHEKDYYEWNQYLNRKHFPIMWSTLITFGAGIAGVVVGMDQYYYVGRIARLIGSGCEIGALLAVGFCTVAYVPTRYLEIRLRNDVKIKP